MDVIDHQNSISLATYLRAVKHSTVLHPVIHSFIYRYLHLMDWWSAGVGCHSSALIITSKVWFARWWAITLWHCVHLQSDCETVCYFFFINVHCDRKLKSPKGWEAVWLKKHRCSVNLSAARERGLIWDVFASSYSNADIKLRTFSPFLYISLHGAESEGEHLLLISS